MRKKKLLLFVLSSLVVFSLVAANDTTEFNIHIIINHGIQISFSIEDYSPSSQISPDPQNENEYLRDLGTIDSSLQSYELCKINFSTNKYGLNQILINAGPLVQVDASGTAIPNSDTYGYFLYFDDSENNWSDSFEVTNDSPVSNFVIPITVSFVLDEDGVVGSHSCSYYVTAAFPYYDEMCAGSYRAIVSMGLEAL